MTPRGWWAVSAIVWGCAGPGSPALRRADEALRSARPREGALLLTCVPADSEVYLDGVLQGTCLDFGGTPRGLGVSEGLHEVAVKKAGFQPYVTYYSPGGTRAALTLELTPSPGTEGASR